jgi:hypothetical protein
MRNILSVLIISLIAIPAFAGETEVGEVAAGAVAGVGAADFTANYADSVKLSRHYHALHKSLYNEYEVLLARRETLRRELTPLLQKDLRAAEKAVRDAIERNGEVAGAPEHLINYRDNLRHYMNEATNKNPEILKIEQQLQETSAKLGKVNVRYMWGDGRPYTLGEKAASKSFKAIRGAGVAAIGVGAYIYFKNSGEKAEEFQAPQAEVSAPSEPTNINANLDD